MQTSRGFVKRMVISFEEWDELAFEAAPLMKWMRGLRMWGVQEVYLLISDEKRYATGPDVTVVPPTTESTRFEDGFLTIRLFDKSKNRSGLRISDEDWVDTHLGEKYLRSREGVYNWQPLETELDKSLRSFQANAAGRARLFSEGK